MARIVHCHPRLTRYSYHIYTDLDFWDARKLLKDLALVKRNFGEHPPGNEFPTQVVGNGLGSSIVKNIERRLKKAISSPPRHVIVNSILEKGYFEFNPLDYYPARWGRSRMLRFTNCRLPVGQSALSSPYKTTRISWVGEKIRIEKVQRKQKHDPAIRTRKESNRRRHVPTCF